MINLTGKAVTLCSSNASRTVVLPPSNLIARISQHVCVGTMAVEGVEISVLNRRYGTVEGLDAAMVFGPVLVSLDVLLAVPGRENVYAVDPTTATYDRVDDTVVYTHLLQA